jgi:hypothetical protein
MLPLMERNEVLGGTVMLLGIFTLSYGVLAAVLYTML